MTNRVAYAPQDVQKMCKQAERDHENRKLILLMDRVKKQIAAGQNRSMSAGGPKPPIGGDTTSSRLPIRSVPLER